MDHLSSTRRIQLISSLTIARRMDMEFLVNQTRTIGFLSNIEQAASDEYAIFIRHVHS